MLAGGGVMSISSRTVRTSPTTTWALTPIHEHISDAKQRKGIESDSQLAAVAGIDRNTLGRVLSGKARASDRTVAALASALGCHPNQLFAWTPAHTTGVLQRRSA